MPKKKDPSPPPPPPPDDEYSIGGVGSDDGYEEEETDEEKIKDELLKQYKSGKLALIEPEPEMEKLPAESSEYPLGPSMSDSYFPEDPRRMMPSQLQMKYLLQPDDVPSSINKKLWAIVSRHLELINIESINEIPYYQRDVRQIIRVASWDWDMRDISFADMQQVEFYAVQVLLKKSIRHGERLALMTTIQRSQVEEYAERSPGMSGGGGFIGAIRSWFGGGRR